MHVERDHIIIHIIILFGSANKDRSGKTRSSNRCYRILISKECVAQRLSNKLREMINYSRKKRQTKSESFLWQIY